MRETRKADPVYVQKAIDSITEFQQFLLIAGIIVIGVGIFVIRPTMMYLGW